jgi:Domain of unknown function (DUF4411)
MAESAEETIYVIDASSWISIEGNPDANRILAHIDALAQRGAIKCPPQCLNEVRSEYLAGWIKIRRKQLAHSVRAKIEFLKVLGDVTFKFAGMAGARGFKNRADPYLIAYAAYRNANENPTKCVVVCNESAALRANRKIPTACKAFDVESITLQEMLSREFPDQDW